MSVIQGVAEFLPISSSGHLVLVQKLFGLEEVPLLFDVFLHLATLAAVVLYFWRKIWELLKVLGRLIARKPRPENTINPEDDLCGDDKAGRKTILAIIITTAITGVIGIITSKIIPDLSIKVTCAGFFITAILLIVSGLVTSGKLPARNGRYFRRNPAVPSAPASSTVKNQAEAQNDSAASVADKAAAPKGVSVIQAVIIGIMQGLGTLPGISRSGSTIAGALYSGVDQKAAGDYSFLVSIPAILGAFILEVKDLGEVNEMVGAAPIIAGCAAAFAVGYISLTLLMKIIRKGKLYWFAAYLIPLSIAGIIFF